MLSSIHPLPKRALFDLDHTLLEGDCGQLWLRFLTQEGVITESDWRPRLTEFYQDYRNGCLDIAAYTGFQLGFLPRASSSESAALRQRYCQLWLQPRLRPPGLERVKHYQEAGVPVVIVTATHRYFAEGLAATIGVDDLIATETDTSPEGRQVLRGAAAFGEGKRIRAEEWCTAQGLSLKDCHFYSDSHNDLPLLRAAGRAFVVSPDETLATHAEQNAWTTLDWRSELGVDG